MKVQIDYIEYQNDDSIENQLCKMIRSVIGNGENLINISTKYMNEFFQVVKKIELIGKECNIETKYTFDDYGKIIKEEIIDSNNLKKNIIDYTYDGMRLKTKTDILREQQLHIIINMMVVEFLKKLLQVVHMQEH